MSFIHCGRQRMNNYFLSMNAVGVVVEDIYFIYISLVILQELIKPLVGYQSRIYLHLE